MWLSGGDIILSVSGRAGVVPVVREDLTRGGQAPCLALLPKEA